MIIHNDIEQGNYDCVSILTSYSSVISGEIWGGSLSPQVRENQSPENLMLTLVNPITEKTKEGRKQAMFMCACGAIIMAAIGRVTCGYKKSCGCDTKAKQREAKTMHGGRYSITYSSWSAMKQRCLNKKSKDFRRYGAAGITIHQEWIDSFQSFIDYVGKRPSRNHQIDRIDNTKGYFPDNVKWSTVAENVCNRSSSKIWHVKGKVFYSAQHAADHFRVSDMTIHRWCKGKYGAKKRKDCYCEARYP